MRRAVGDAAGLTIKGQVRQAARNLGYAVDDWRVREAFYGRAGSWSAAALDDLRRRFAAWRESAMVVTAADPPMLVQRVGAIRQKLAELTRQVDEIAVEVARDDLLTQQLLFAIIRS